MAQAKNLIPLIQASALIRRSYNQTLRLVLLGEIRGERREGRWFVDRVSAERFAADHRTSEASGHVGVA